MVENKLDELSEKVEIISTKGFPKDLMNGYSILKGAKYFSSGVLQNYLVFISANKCNESFSGAQKIYSWKSKGMSEESIKIPPGSNNTFAPSLIDYCPLSYEKVCWKLFKTSSISLHVVNLYVSYTLDTWSRDLKTDFRLKCLLSC